jgi:GNAT superfamily N-acetyltransferase
VAPSLSIDALRPEDVPEALRLSTQSGWNQTAADWTRVLEGSLDGAFAGRVDGELVATSAVVEYGSRAAWIGMVLVDEACRGRGYGTELLHRAVTHAERNVGEAFGLDATGLGRPLYLKMGFVDVAPIDRWSGVLRDRPAGRPLAWIEGDVLAEVARRDRELCGTDRTALLRHLRRDEETAAWAVLEDGKPSAWAFLRRGRLASHLGPVVAPSADAFRALLGAAARELKGAPVLVDAFREEETRDLLAEAGLETARRLTRMTWKRPQTLLMGPGVRAATAFEWG